MDRFVALRSCACELSFIDRPYKFCYMFFFLNFFQDQTKRGSWASVCFLRIDQCKTNLAKILNYFSSFFSVFLFLQLDNTVWIDVVLLNSCIKFYIVKNFILAVCAWYLIIYALTSKIIETWCNILHKCLQVIAQKHSKHSTYSLHILNCLYKKNTLSLYIQETQIKHNITTIHA